MSSNRFFPTDTALVTGASSGIGFELAKRLDEHGVKHIYLVARREHRLSALASELSCDTTIIPCDLTSPSKRQALLNRISSVDILINNAGFGARGTFGDQDTSTLTDMIELHVKATVELCHHFLEGMRQNKRGFIVNVGSSIEFSVPNSALYCATKAFINNFTETLRMEEANHGIKTLLLAPGPVSTSLLNSHRSAVPYPKVQSHPKLCHKCA